MELVLLTTLMVMSLVAMLTEFRSVDYVTLGRRWGLIPFMLKFSRHMCIYGPTRSGKTSFVRGLIRELSRNYVITVLDWHGEYTDLEDIPSIPYSKLRIDLSKISVKLLVEVLGHGLNLNEPSLYMLYRILKASNIETIEDIVKSVEEYFATTRTEAEMKAAILRRLEYVLSSLSQGLIDIELLTRYSCSVDLSTLTVIEEKRLAASLVLASLYVYYMNSGLVTDSVRHIIVVEEAQNLLSRDPRVVTILDHMIMELGKYGVRVVLVTNMMPPAHILKHCTLIMFKTRFEQIEREVVLSDELRRAIASMDESEVLVLTPSSIVKIRPLKHKVKRTYLRTLEHKPDLITSTIETERLSRERAHVQDITTRSNTLTTASSLTANADKPSQTRAEDNDNAYGETEYAEHVSAIDLQRYVNKLDDIEKKLVLIRERLDEIERSVAYEDEILSRLLSLLEEK